MSSSIFQGDTDAFLTRLRHLRTELAQRSLSKHGETIEKGLNSLEGNQARGQSHAYANSSMWLEQIIIDFENGNI